MTYIILERNFDVSCTAEAFLARTATIGWCFEMHRVEWQKSFLSADGRTMVCWFKAPDAESTRLALRRLGADISRLWSGTVEEAPHPEKPNVLVEWSFATPLDAERVQAVATTLASGPHDGDVHFVRSFVSGNRQRLLSQFRAPDTDAVSKALRDVDLPFDAVWSFQQLGPEDLKPLPT